MQEISPSLFPNVLINRWLSKPDKLWNTTEKNFRTLYFSLQTSWAAPVTCQTDDSDHALYLYRVLYYRCDKEWSYHKPICRALHYHTFWELKLFINFFDVLFKCVNKYLRNIIIVQFFYKSNWLLRIECIVKTLCGNKIR